MIRLDHSEGMWRKLGDKEWKNRIEVYQRDCLRQEGGVKRKNRGQKRAKREKNRVD